MDYLLNTYVFQYLPFHVSDPTRKYVIDKAVSIVQVTLNFLFVYNLQDFRLPIGSAKLVLKYIITN